MSVSVVIVAAGKGERFGSSGVSKVFAPLAGRPLIAYSLNAFNRMHEISEIILVAQSGVSRDTFRSAVGESPLGKVTSIIPGGSTRAQSVRSGLQAVSASVDIVLIHDAARPLITPSLVRSVIDGAEFFGAAIPVVKIKPTVKRVDAEGFVVKTQDRSFLREAQTPQGFKLNLIRDAFMQAQDADSATDDAYLIETFGGRVKAVEGDYRNIKITTPEDLELAERYINALQTESHKT